MCLQQSNISIQTLTATNDHSEPKEKVRYKCSNKQTTHLLNSLKKWPMLLKKWTVSYHAFVHFMNIRDQVNIYVTGLSQFKSIFKANGRVVLGKTSEEQSLQCPKHFLAHPFYTVQNVITEQSWSAFTFIIPEKLISYSMGGQSSNLFHISS